MRFSSRWAERQFEQSANTVKPPYPKIEDDMTNDERIIAEVEARVRGTFEDGMTFGQITRADFDSLLNSRLAWKHTAKCFSAGRETPIEEALRLANADKESMLRRIETEISSAEALPNTGEINALLKAGRLGSMHTLRETFVGAGWVDPREPAVR